MPKPNGLAYQDPAIEAHISKQRHRSNWCRHDTLPEAKPIHHYVFLLTAKQCDDRFNRAIKHSWQSNFQFGLFGQHATMPAHLRILFLKNLIQVGRSPLDNNNFAIDLKHDIDQIIVHYEQRSIVKYPENKTKLQRYKFIRSCIDAYAKSKSDALIELTSSAKTTLALTNL